MNFGQMAPQLTQLLNTLNKSAGAMGVGGATPQKGGPFTMPEGGMMGIMSGKSMPNGLLGMIMNSMNQPKPLAAPGVAPAQPAAFGSLMPQAPANPLGPIY